MCSLFFPGPLNTTALSFADTALLFPFSLLKSKKTFHSQRAKISRATARQAQDMPEVTQICLKQQCFSTPQKQLPRLDDSLSPTRSSPGQSTTSSPIRTNNPYGVKVLNDEHAKLGEMDFEQSSSVSREYDIVLPPEHEEENRLAVSVESDDSEAPWLHSAFPFHFAACSTPAGGAHPLPIAVIEPSKRRLPPTRYVVVLCQKCRITPALSETDVPLGAVVLVQAGNWKYAVDAGVVQAKMLVGEFETHVSRGTLPPLFPLELPVLKILSVARDDELLCFGRLEADEQELADRIRAKVSQLPTTDDNSHMEIVTVEFQFDRRWVYVYFRAPWRVRFGSFLNVIFQLAKCKVWMHQIDRPTPRSSANTSLASASSATGPAASAADTWSEPGLPEVSAVPIAVDATSSAIRDEHQQGRSKPALRRRYGRR